jgi:HemY protein
MRRIVFYLFLAVWLGLICTAAYVLARRPGDVSVVWLDRQIDMPIWFVLVGLIVAMVAVVILWQIVRLVFGTPGRFGRARQDRRRRKAYRALTQGMVAVAAGDATEAQRQAKLAGNLLDDPPLTLLLEAQAAQLGGDEKAATRYFRAMLDRPEAAFLGLRGLLMQALKTGNDAAALGYARQAVTERPKTAWAVSTLLDLELRSAAWPQAEATLKRAEKLKVVEAGAARRIRAVLLTEQARTGDLDAAIARLREAVKLAPELVPARVLLAATLTRAGRGREAARLIEQGWTASPHAELAAAYAQIDPAEDALARARRFERLAGLNPAHPESRIALAGANLAAGLWGPARAELEKALADAGGEAAASQRLARLMAHLEEGEGADPAAARRWLIAAASAPPDPAWTCEKCGTIATAWTARCAHCHQFDSLVWRATPRPAPLALDGGLPAVPALAAPAAPSNPPAPEPPAPMPAGGEAPRPAADAAPVDAARLVN